jgi:eukaryotic-like serine/threonine-protein kinase
MNNLALVYQLQRKYAQAEPLFSKALEGCRRVLGEEHPETLIITANLAVLYRNERRYAEAEPLFTNVLEMRLRVLGEEHPETLTSMNSLAALYMNQGTYAQAEPLYTKVLEVRRRVLGEEHPSVLLSMNNLGLLYIRQGRYSLAQALLREALTSYEKTTPNAWRRYDTQSLLGASLAGQKMYGEAEPLVVSGYEGMLQREVTVPIESRFNLERAGAWIVQLYRDWGKPEKAAAWTQKLHENSLSDSPEKP